MSHQNSLVNLSLSEPTGLLSGEENFNGNILCPPSAHPHLSIPPLAYLLHHLDLLGYRSLHLKRRTNIWNGLLKSVTSKILRYAIKPMCVLHCVSGNVAP